MSTAFGHSLHGILPPMTTPFDERGGVVESAIREQVAFLLEAGVHGIVAGGSTRSVATPATLRVSSRTVAM